VSESTQERALRCKLSNREDAIALLSKIADRLQTENGGITAMGRKDVILYLLGCCRSNLLEKENLPDMDAERAKPIGERRTDKLYEILTYFFEEQDNFERDEIERIVTALWYHDEEYRNVIDILPKSWTSFVDEILVALEERQEEHEREQRESGGSSASQAIGTGAFA